ncbi:hypothetical protein KKJFFJLC_00058 [Vibrio phage vB_VpaS_PGB]|nr:hypothetical protein HHKILHMN_00039 [Vibrio phage vB_VpaS_PGA]WVH05601.1 hypothetical protein KKJFFJLC_00058 [Vibrio phage vB_VpaS_PGB]
MINENAKNDWLPGVLDKLSNRIKRDIEKCIPCEVVAVHSRTMVSVKPLIMMVDADGNRVSRQKITNIPVETIGAGDVLISFPIKTGDLGWIEASDRDISLFLQSYSESQPGTRRMHSFRDAKFIPDIMTNFTVAGEDSSAVVIQNRDGSVKIALDQSEVRVKNGAASIVIDDSSVTGVAPGGFNLNGFIINASGEFQTASGLSSSGGNVSTSSGVTLDTHNHNVSSVTAGTDTVTSDAPNT